MKEIKLIVPDEVGVIAVTTVSTKRSINRTETDIKVKAFDVTHESECVID